MFHVSLFLSRFSWSLSASEVSTHSVEVSVKNSVSMFSSQREHMGKVELKLAELDLSGSDKKW